MSDYSTSEYRETANVSHPSTMMCFGRRYLASVPYPFPVDEREEQRQNFQNKLLRELMGSSLLSPVVSPSSILDIGYGSGSWAQDVAGKYPEAHVAGVDIIPPRETVDGSALRENTEFIQADIFDEKLPFADESFDVVHIRSMAAVAPQHLWQDLIRETARITKIGGWVEIVEEGKPQNTTPSYAIFDEWQQKLFAARGIQPFPGAAIGSSFPESQFAFQKRYKSNASARIDVSSESDPIAALTATYFMGTLESLGPIIASCDFASEREVRRVIESIRSELLSATIPPSILHYFTAAQRVA